MLFSSEYSFGVPLSLLQRVHSPCLGTITIPGKLSWQVEHAATVMVDISMWNFFSVSWTLQSPNVGKNDAKVSLGLFSCGSFCSTVLLFSALLALSLAFLLLNLSSLSSLLS